MGGVRFQSIFRGIAIAILILLLSSCSVTFSLGGFQPTRDVVQRALALELSQNQQQLRQHLSRYVDRGDKMPNYEIKRVEIWKEEPLKIEDLLSYHIRGSYNLTIQLPDKRVTERQNSFDLYLQRQTEGKTWRLAKPVTPEENDEAPAWATYLIKPPGYM
jgi:hypothetical protein